MLSEDQIDELFLQISSTNFQQDTIRQDPTPSRIANNIPIPSDVNCKRQSKQRKKNQFTGRENINDMIKKMMHREIEKQRRQEMTALFAILRSVLPYEYIKGRRSMSDQINQAMCYIQDTKNRVKGLSDKRDKLKKSLDSSALFPDTSKTFSSSSLIVQPFGEGIEMIYKTKFQDEQSLPLHQLVELVVKEGLDIISCVSTRVHNSLLHTIYSQVSDSKELDLPGLQQKIHRAILHFRKIPK